MVVRKVHFKVVGKLRNCCLDSVPRDLNSLLKNLLGHMDMHELNCQGKGEVLESQKCWPGYLQPEEATTPSSIHAVD